MVIDGMRKAREGTRRYKIPGIDGIPGYTRVTDGMRKALDGKWRYKKQGIEGIRQGNR